MSGERRLRIGELSKRVGESPELLRAWELRYALVEPERTSGGQRLYSARDEHRVKLMRRHIDAGATASEAARLAKLADDPATDGGEVSLEVFAASLEGSFDGLDEPAAQAALDTLLASVSLRQALQDVILPFLHRVGDRWESADMTVAEEHFASNIIGGRLRSLTRGWGDGVGPLAALACPPGELHDLGLVAFGLLLRERGWRIAYLGTDLPLHDLTILDELSPTIFVLAATSAQRFSESAEQIRKLTAHWRVGIAGTGASDATAHQLRAESLVGDLFSVAEALAVTT